MSKIHLISGGGGVILYRIRSFLSPRTDLNFRHLSSCDTIGLSKWSIVSALRTLPVTLIKECPLGHLEISLDSIAKYIGLHDAIYLTNSFVYTLGHCVDFQAMRYE